MGFSDNVENLRLIEAQNLLRLRFVIGNYHYKSTYYDDFLARNRMLTKFAARNAKSSAEAMRSRRANRLTVASVGALV